MKHSFFLWNCILVICLGCQTQSTGVRSQGQYDASDVVGLVQPIRLDAGANTLLLSDYFMHPEEIDSVILEGRKLALDSLKTVISAVQYPISILEVYQDGRVYHLPLQRSEKIKYILKISKSEAPADIQELRIKGEMNAWNSNQGLLKESGAYWIKEFWLSPGSYEYVLLVDGVETIDWSNDQRTDNGMGGTNSILHVKGIRVVGGLDISVEEYGETWQIKSPGSDSLMVLLDHSLLKVTNLDSGNFQFKLPPSNQIKGRHHLRIWAQNRSQRSFELLVPLENGRPVISPEQLDRNDWHTAVMYNIFVDRFFNGDTLNDQPNSEKDIHPRANHHGGDIVGAVDKLEAGYFDALGINTLWISPIVKNTRGAYGRYPTPNTRFSAYHGYWPISFTEVDERLTTENELRQLVSRAHEMECNVLLDFIANHVHEEHPFYKQNPEIATSLYLEDGSLNTEKWDEHRLTTWFDTFMPSLDLTNAKVANMLADSAVYWIEHFGFDGFRHDATKHVPISFWRTLTRKLKERIVVSQNKPLYQIGETYGTSELISNYLGTGLLDAQFDFNLYDALVRTLVQRESFKNIENEVENSLKSYGDHHLMGNISGNQDRARFISYASGALSLDEDSKLAGWTRHVGIKDSTAYVTSGMLHVLLATLPGVPVIYYGDEIGLAGGNDPDNRKMMRFEDWNSREAQLWNQTSKLLHFRRSSLPMMYGTINFLTANDDMLVFERRYLDQRAVVVLNQSEKEQTIDLMGGFNQALMGRDIAGKGPYNQSQLPARSFEVYHQNIEEE